MTDLKKAEKDFIKPPYITMDSPDFLCLIALNLLGSQKTYTIYIYIQLSNLAAGAATAAFVALRFSCQWRLAAKW